MTWGNLLAFVLAIFEGGKNTILCKDSLILRSPGRKRETEREEYYLYLMQGTLTEGESSVHLTSAIIHVSCKKHNFSMKSSYPERVNARRSTVLILPFSKDSLQKFLIFNEAVNNVQMLQLFSCFDGAFTS
jgi:hypothetical protein